MILRARTLLTMLGHPIADGAVVVENGMLVDVGPFTELRRHHISPVEDLGEQILMPGLINAHCHLDYTGARKAIAPPSSFTHWIERINALKHSFDKQDYLEAITVGFEELKRWGITTVLNIESFPDLLDELPPPPLRTWWFCEFIDVRRSISSAELDERLRCFSRPRDGWLGGYGVSPHSPYTASLDLFRIAADTGLPLTTHISESDEETQMFSEQRGPLYDFLAKVGRQMDDCGKSSPLGHLGPLVESHWIIAHLNELQEADFTLLRKVRPHIVHCPLSHSYFGHTPFPYERLQGMGLNICIGTDSLASNQQLNLFAEMRTAQKTNPWLRADELVEAVTVNPACALNMQGKLGVLAQGAYADLIALPYTGGLDGVFEAVVDHKQPVEWMMVHGRKV